MGVDASRYALVSVAIGMTLTLVLALILIVAALATLPLSGSPVRATV